MTTAQQVIDIARSQVGYREGYSNGHWNNIEKYAAEVPGLEWANGQPWCDVFVAWVYRQAGLQGVPVSASVYASMVAWQKMNRWSEYPAIGAQVIFGRNVHTGIVIAYDADTITSIEGNTNTSGSPEGDGVYIKTHQRRDPYVTGYGYPEFEEGIQSADPAWQRSSGSGAGGGVPSGSVTPPPPPNLGLPVLSIPDLIVAFTVDGRPSTPTGTLTYGDPRGARALEQALVDVGLLRPEYVDGSLGTMTRAAYALWQKALGYSGKDADGIPGRASLTALGKRTNRFTVA